MCGFLFPYPRVIPAYQADGQKSLKGAQKKKNTLASQREVHLPECLEQSWSRPQVSHLPGAGLHASPIYEYLPTHMEGKEITQRDGLLGKKQVMALALYSRQ